MNKNGMVSMFKLPTNYLYSEYSTNKIHCGNALLYFEQIYLYLDTFEEECAVRV